MKTLVFPSEFIDNKGGVPQTIIELVRGLAHHNDFKIVLICPASSEMAKTTFPENVQVVTTSSRWHISRTSWLRTLETIIEVYIKLKPFLGEDSWVVTNHSVTSSLISLMPLRHVKEIYINRGGEFSDKGAASRLLLRKIKKSKISYAVGISQRQVTLLINSGIPKDKVFLIHDGLPLPQIQYKKTSLTTDLLRISTMGFISDLKNQVEGVRLIQMLRANGVNAFLNIYGGVAEENYHKKLLTLIRELDVTDYVKIHGFVSGERLFDDTDVLVSFSKSEGFGRTLVEAMLRYKPVIAWQGAGGPIDITENGKYGYLVENNAALDYFNVVMSMLHNTDNCMKNVEESYQYASLNFTTEGMVRKYNDFFLSVCDR